MNTLQYFLCFFISFDVGVIHKIRPEGILINVKVYFKTLSHSLTLLKSDLDGVHDLSFRMKFKYNFLSEKFSRRGF